MLLELLRKICNRDPDVIIGGPEDPYLRRWHVIPRNRFFNIYLHHFLRSDDDRALHDHPWWNMSLLLDGIYWEHTPEAVFLRKPGALYFRGGKSLHRVELEHDWVEALKTNSRPKERPVWTLFITGPRFREWGFACPKGWVHWEDFTADDGNTVGKGCGEA